MKRSLTLLLLATLALSAAAQVSDDGQQPVEPRQYAVEIIIFEYAEEFAVGSEIFVPDVVEEQDGDLIFEDRPPPEQNVVRPNLRQLAEDELSLRETYGRLRRLQAYRPLMFFGWVQDTVPDVETAPVPVEEFGNPPDGLGGTVSLNLRRYLHLGVDLTLAANEEYQPPAPGYLEDRGADGVVQADERRTTQRYAPLAYRLAEERIMKSDDVRYYDHPKFGVVAKVRRIEDGERVAAGDQQLYQ